MRKVGSEIWVQGVVRRKRRGRGGHSICGPLGQCGHRQGVMSNSKGRQWAQTGGDEQLKGVIMERR